MVRAGPGRRVVSSSGPPCSPRCAGRGGWSTAPGGARFGVLALTAIITQIVASILALPFGAAARRRSVARADRRRTRLLARCCVLLGRHDRRRGDHLAVRRGGHRAALRRPADAPRGLDLELARPRRRPRRPTPDRPGRCARVLVAGPGRRPVDLGRDAAAEPPARAGQAGLPARRGLADRAGPLGARAPGRPLLDRAAGGLPRRLPRPAGRARLAGVRSRSSYGSAPARWPPPARRRAARDRPAASAAEHRAAAAALRRRAAGGPRRCEPGCARWSADLDERGAARRAGPGAPPTSWRPRWPPALPSCASAVRRGGAGLRRDLVRRSARRPRRRYDTVARADDLVRATQPVVRADR